MKCLLVSLLLLVCMLPRSQCDDLTNIVSKYNAFLETTSQQRQLSEPGVDPECHMNFCEISKYHGFQCEEYLHQIVTDDGFLLTLHRINSRLTDTVTNTSRPPVFVQHGLLCDSTSWILNLPGESLPFLLSDAGYDVWVGNSRGNTYSRAHKTLKPNTDAFWAWSWDEMAHRDLPASIDFALNHTAGYKSLHYIGHSQGTLIAFTFLSQNPSYGKISHMIAMGPVFQVAHMLSPIKYFAPLSKDIDAILKIFGLRDFLPNSFIFNWLADNFCNEFDPLHPICGDILFILCGSDVQQLNQTRMPVYINHTPAGTSTRDIMHFAQMVLKHQTGAFDYGSEKENMKHYNSSSPPVYSISSINTPVSLFYGLNDWLADPQDVQYIINNVKTIKNNVQVPVAAWNHLDFVWGLDANKIVYEPILKIIKEDLQDGNDE